MKRAKPTTSSRKKDHVLLTVHKNVTFLNKQTGFDEWEFIHNALPEINFSEVTTATTFLGKRIAFPFMISCMTGGYADAKRINKQLAEVCEEFGIAMGVGSQRQALEDTTYHSTFSIVRAAAPSIPIVGNIGAPEVAALRDVSSVQRLVEMIRADAFAVHLNPLQEFLQPEGNTNFRGVLLGIEKLVKHLSVPVIVKEIGAGISGEVASRLMNVGVTIIDVAGAGGTSWAGVEILRRKENGKARASSQQFWDWGIPTVDALHDVVQLKNSKPELCVVASGGITSGLDCAKALALGADMTASARPMLQALCNGGKKELAATLNQWMHECKGAMFLTGIASLEEFRRDPIYIGREIIKKKN
mgnify:CR=1 FL=1